MSARSSVQQTIVEVGKRESPHLLSLSPEHSCPRRGSNTKPACANRMKNHNTVGSHPHLADMEAAAAGPNVL